MKRWKQAAGWLCACCLVAGAIAAAPVINSAPQEDEAANLTTPPHQGLQASPNGRSSVHPSRIFGGRRVHGEGSHVSANEWEQVSAFMSAHSPVRLAFIDGLPMSSRKAAMQNYANRIFQAYQRAVKDDPKLAEVIVKRVELEDQVFDLAGQIRRAEPGDRDGTKRLLRQKVGELVDINIEERQLRLASLEATIKSEQTRLAQDVKQRDKLVDDKFNAVLHEAKRFIPRHEQEGRSAIPPIPPDTSTQPE